VELIIIKINFSQRMVDTQTVQAEGAFISTEQLASMIASYPKD